MKKIIAFSILILTLASCSGFKHRQIVFQKEDRKQVIVENKKQESPKEFTTEKKEVKTSIIDVLANSNNNIEEEASNQSINIEVEYNSPSLINDEIKKDTKALKKNKKRDPKNGLKNDKKGIIAFIFSILGTILLVLGLAISPYFLIFSCLSSLVGFIMGIKSLRKNKREKNKISVKSILAIVFGGLFILFVLAIIVLFAILSGGNYGASYYGF